MNLEEAQDVIENGTGLPELVVDNPSRAIWGIAGTIVASAAIGLFIGYRIGVKKTSLRYEEILEEEIQKAKEFYASRYKTGAFETPGDAARALIDSKFDPEVAKKVLSVEVDAKEAFRKYNGESLKNSEETSTAVVTANVFEGTVDFDIEQERSKREAHPEEPHVISRDEYLQNESENSQATVTWFEEDGVLLDDKDQIIADIEGTVGEDNLLRFGHGSGDNKIVYIRNPYLDMDFEVVKSGGSYAREVFGHVQHEDRPGVRRLRRRDE